MAYSAKLLKSDQNSVETDIANFLNTTTPTTIHAINSFKRGVYIFTIIVYE